MKQRKYWIFERIWSAGGGPAPSASRNRTRPLHDSGYFSIVTNGINRTIPPTFLKNLVLQLHPLVTLLAARQPNPAKFKLMQSLARKKGETANLYLNGQKRKEESPCFNHEDRRGGRT
jgi:hypothetical protein